MTRYATKVTGHWERYTTHMGDPLLRWSKTNVPQRHRDVVFYPFAGPDLSTVIRVFPRANRYVLVALQQGGRPPDLEAMPDLKLKEVLRLFESGLEQFSKRGFFLTKEMNEQFERGTTVAGITGIIAAFAELDGFDIEGIEPVRVNAKTGLVEPYVAGRGRPRWASVRFTLRSRGDGRAVTVDYLRINLYDEYLRKGPGHAKLIERLAGYPTFLKAASHLMDQPGFVDIRDALLERAPLIVQDESGVPFSMLDERFDVTLYGRFEIVSLPFRDSVNYQALREAYQTRPTGGPVAFPIGYHKPQGSCLMIAKRKGR